MWCSLWQNMQFDRLFYDFLVSYGLEQIMNIKYKTIM